MNGDRNHLHLACHDHDHHDHHDDDHDHDREEVIVNGDRDHVRTRRGELQLRSPRHSRPLLQRRNDTTGPGFGSDGVLGTVTVVVSYYCSQISRHLLTLWSNREQTKAARTKLTGTFGLRMGATVTTWGSHIRTTPCFTWLARILPRQSMVVKFPSLSGPCYPTATKCPVARTTGTLSGRGQWLLRLAERLVLAMGV